MKQPTITPAQGHLLSTTDGLKVVFDSKNKPPEWAYITNDLDERVFFYSTHDLWLTIDKAALAATGEEGT